MKLYRDPETGNIYQYREGRAPANFVPFTREDETTEAEPRPERPRRTPKATTKARKPRNKAREADDK